MKARRHHQKGPGLGCKLLVAIRHLKRDEISFMATLTLRNTGFPSNSPPGSVARAGVEVRAGVGPGPQWPSGIPGVPGNPGASGPGGATGPAGATGPVGDTVVASGTPPASPTPGTLYTVNDGLYLYNGTAWVQLA